MPYPHLFSPGAIGTLQLPNRIIMGSMRCDAEQAFNYLVQQSQHTNTKLRTVAQGIVDDIARRSQS